VTELIIWRAVLASPLLLLALAFPARPAEPARPGGTIDLGDDTRVEVLSDKVPVGRRIDLPEGWYRVEEAGVEDGEVGSFTVASAPASTEGAVAVPAAVASPEPAASPAAFAISAMKRNDACREERTAYLRQLWRESGVEVSDPDALVRGLDAGTFGPGVAFLWSALSTDAIRNLAWSSELRSRAQELIGCVQRER
jgi:hypothetical protein